MSETFDPYYRWLGISPKHQPPNHYQLLGLEVLEDDVEVIHDAAARQIAHVRSCQFREGEYAEQAKQILGELAAAKVCLTDSARKADYDAQLQTKASRAEADTGTPISWQAKPAQRVPGKSGASPRRSAPPPAQRRRTARPLPKTSHVKNRNRPAQVIRKPSHARQIVAVGVAALILAVLALGGWSILRSGDPALEKEDAPPPELAAVDDMAIRVGGVVSCEARNQRAGIETEELEFYLVEGAPTKASINSATGTFLWQTSEVDSPGVYEITIGVRRKRSPQQRDEKSFRVTLEQAEEETLPPTPNRAPTIAVVDVIPAEPTVGDQVAFVVMGEDPEDDLLVYKYRREGETNWQTADVNTVIFRALPAGDLALEFIALDVHGARSAPYTVRASVVASEVHEEMPSEPKPPVVEIAKPETDQKVQNEDSKRLPISSLADRIRTSLRDPSPLTLDASLTAIRGPVADLRFTHDGRCLVAVQSGDLRVIDVFSRQQMAVMAGTHEAMLWNTVIGPRGNTLAVVQHWIPNLLGQFTTSPQRILKTKTAIGVYDLPTGRGLHRLLERNGNMPACIAYSPDGSTLATGGTSLRLWNVESGNQIRQFEAGGKTIFATVLFTADGQRLISRAKKGISVWDVTTGRILHSFSHPDIGAGPLVAGSTRTCILTGDIGRRPEYHVREWDVATGRQVRTLATHDRMITSLAVSPDSDFIASCGSQKDVKIWDVERGVELRTLSQEKHLPKFVAFSTDGCQLASAADDQVFVWKLTDTSSETGREKTDNTPTPKRALTERLVLTPREPTAHAVAFSSDNRILAVASNSGIELFSMPDGVEHTFVLDEEAVTSIAFSPDNSILVSGSGKRGTIIVWDTATGKRLETMRKHSSPVTSLAFASTGSMFVSGDAAGESWLWDVDKRRHVRKLPDRKARQSQVAFSVDGRSIVAGYSAGLRFWSEARNYTPQTVKGDSSPVLSVDFSPSGRLLACGCVNGTIVLWNMETHSTAQTLAAPSASVQSLAFGQRGEILAAGDKQGFVRVWDVRSGKQVATVVGQKITGPHSLAFNHDGSQLATIRSDGAVTIWNGALIEPSANADDAQELKKPAQAKQQLTPEHKRLVEMKVQREIAKMARTPMSQQDQQKIAERLRASYTKRALKQLEEVRLP